MELAPVPRRPRIATRGRMLLALAVFLPITLFALVPAVLGLQRYVVADDAMNGGINRGSLVIERRVPSGDLHVGDVITFRPTTGGDGSLVTRRIISIDGTTATTRGDANGSVDDWTVDLSEGSQSRVLVHVPYIGYPFVAGVGRSEGVVLLVVPLLILGAASAADLTRRRHGRRSATVPS